MRLHRLPTDWDVLSWGMFKSKLQLYFPFFEHDDCPADAVFVCGKAAVPWDTIQRTLYFLHFPHDELPFHLEEFSSGKLKHVAAIRQRSTSFHLSQSSWIGAVNAIELVVGAHVPSPSVHRTWLTLTWFWCCMKELVYQATSQTGDELLRCVALT
jgi:hypothetical protein